MGRLKGIKLVTPESYSYLSSHSEIDPDFIYTTSKFINLSDMAKIVSIEKPNDGQLPQSNIQTNVIYLIPNSSSSQENVYDEYMWINSRWEIIGSTYIDLSNYYTKTEVGNLGLGNDVKLTGDQTVEGEKTFKDKLKVNIDNLSAGSNAIESNGNIKIGASANQEFGIMFTNSSGNTTLVEDTSGDLKISKGLKINTNKNVATEDYVLTKTNALTGSSAPTTSTVAEFVGQLYLNTTNNTTYQCVAINEDTSTNPSTFTYTWVQLIRVTDIANYNNAGVVKVDNTSSTYGVRITSSGLLYNDGATTSDIDAMSSIFKAITPSTLKYALSKAYLTGSSAPTTSTTASFVGQIYIDTAHDKTYQCVAITTENSTTTYTWVQLIRVTDKANTSNYGVVKIAQGRGLDFLSDGGMFVDVAGEVQITNRTIGRPLSTERINFAVLSALTDANHLTMTSTQQTTAQEVIGASPRGIARL